MIVAETSLKAAYGRCDIERPSVFRTGTSVLAQYLRVVELGAETVRRDLLPDDYVFQHVVNHLGRHFDQQNLSG